ncbi:MAG: ATP-binding protein [Pseudomonadota bacterium]
MNWFRSNSLQVRLATRLGALFLLATIILLSVFLYLSYDLTDSLSRRDLFRLAEELAEEIENDGRLDDIEELIARGWLNNDTRYAIFDGETFDSESKVLASSDTAFVTVVLERDIMSGGTESFRLDEFGTPPQNFLGLVNIERSEAGRVAVVVAEPEQVEQELMNAIMWDVVFKALWIVPLFIFCTLLVGVLAIRGGLQPLRRTALEAASIKPEAISARLGTDNLPREVFPLVYAVNSALDRLEAGFELQRRFTANAAHELRTPLAIITGAIDGMAGNGNLKKLRQDVARMNRLVEQLLHVARLDSLTLKTDEPVDLRKIAHQVLEYMAPLAIAQGQSIELVEADTPVSILGEAHAVEDAIRNLIENAIIHGGSAEDITEPSTEAISIEVKVHADGSISVCDQGPGIAVEDRERIFDRFWRGKNAACEGAGLGLSIVQEIMQLHGGVVIVRDNDHAGAARGTCVTLRFRPVTTAH